MSSHSSYSSFHDIAGSATAGFISKFIFHPIDTCKSRIQAALKTAEYKTTAEAFKDTLTKYGIRGLYRGFGAVLVGGIPGTCIYLTSYEVKL
jgi:hypothetical protein